MPNLYIQGLSLKEDFPKNVFPFTIPAVKKLKIRFRKPITFLVGENGSGKSTLLPTLPSCRIFFAGREWYKIS
jgi:predicted ATPase